MIRSHLRLPGRPLLAALLAVAAGCGVPSQGVNAGGAPAVTVLSQATGALPGFADEAGDALLVDAAGKLVRVRLDGTLGPLESHPRNVQSPGKVLGVHPLGPHLALVAAENGLYLAQGGWLIAAPWSSQLSPEGVRGATDAGDGSAWIAHESGLFRLKDGLLSELRIAGGPVQGLTAVQASRAEDGVPGVWFAHSGGLSVVVPTDAGLRVRQASVEGAGTMKVRALTALGDSAAVPGEIWVLTESGEVFRNARDGWR
ncbi:MAG TPA: hypothetical protein VK447_03530, partial [Myxococcaceae bacterium]|nr:hypothetical protein [Myxococcaceae bacterium]